MVNDALKMFTSNMEIEEETPRKEMDISLPLQATFKHEGHVGLSSEGRFETNLPSMWLKQNPAWKQFFLNAGMKPEELEDEKVTKEVIAETMNFIFQMKQAEVEKKEKGGEMHSIEDEIPLAPPQPPSKPSRSEMKESARKSKLFRQSQLQANSKDLDQPLRSASLEDAPISLDAVPDAPPPPPSSSSMQPKLRKITKAPISNKPLEKDFLQESSEEQLNMLKNHLVNFLKKRRMDLREDVSKD